VGNRPADFCYYGPQRRGDMTPAGRKQALRVGGRGADEALTRAAPRPVRASLAGVQAASL